MSATVRRLTAFLGSTTGHIAGLAACPVLIAAELSLLRFGWDMLYLAAPLVVVTLLGMAVIAEEVAQRLTRDPVG